jgi:hypothetical protein
MNNRSSLKAFKKTMTELMGARGYLIDGIVSSIAVLPPN